MWYPGNEPPAWLDGSLPGDYGFDPLGLGSDPETLKWMADAEVIHGRFAMMGTAGILIPGVQQWTRIISMLKCPYIGIDKNRYPKRTTMVRSRKGCHRELQHPFP